MTTSTTSPRTKRTAPLAFAFLVSVVLGSLPAVAPADQVLTNASDVLALSAGEASSGVGVSVKGIVTAAQTNWSGRFFVQDSSGGVFVECLGKEQPVPGDVVEVSGISRAGGYAPCITKPHWNKLGTAPLPEALPVTIEQLMSGTEDSQRIRISGVVRQAWLSGYRLGIELASGGYRFRAFLPIPPGVEPQSLVGAKVLVKGTAATAFNAPLRHFVTVTLFVPQLADFIVEEPAPSHPFDEPLMPLDGIAQYRKGHSPGNQVHVQGVVTYQRKGEDLFLHDATGGLQVKSKLTNSVSPGESVEAVGFPAVENFLPVLEDAVFRKTTDLRIDSEAQAVTTAELLQGRHHADYVTLKGVLMDRLVKSAGLTAAGLVNRTTLVLQTTNFIFVAEKDTSNQNNTLTSIPIGSLIEVSGICLLESGADGKITSLRLLLPALDDVRILKRPDWLTPQHLLASLAIVFVVLLVAISWSVMVSKKNSVLQYLVREKEAAQKELQQAHDKLDERVKERTAQLKVEMTARKESELQFRAVLTERTRLAQELHDTLEQTMTGIIMQLDLVANQFQKNAAKALHHLKLARNLMRQSQSDVRQSVWGLRSRATEPFNLVNVISANSRQIANGASIRLQVEASGELQPMSEVTEENLLRISQEAMTNVVKHSGAGAVKIELRFSPQRVVLQIADDGRGFVPETSAGPKDGHFGLLGIRERAERLGGEVRITSAPNAGTTIRVDIPLGLQNGQSSQTPVADTHEE